MQGCPFGVSIFNGSRSPTSSSTIQVVMEPFCAAECVTGDEAVDRTATSLLTSKQSLELPRCLDDVLVALVSGAAEASRLVAATECPVVVSLDP